MFKNVKCALLLLFIVTSFVSMCMSDNVPNNVPNVDMSAQDKAPCSDSNFAYESEITSKRASTRGARGPAPISSWWAKHVLDSVEEGMGDYFSYIYTDDDTFYWNVRCSSKELFSIRQSMLERYHKKIEHILSVGSEEQKSQARAVIERILGKLSDCTRQLKEHQLRLERAKVRKNRFFFSLGTADLCWLGYAQLKQTGDLIIPGMVGVFLATAYGAMKLDELEHDRKVLLHKNLCFSSLERTTRMWKGLLEKGDSKDV